MLTGSTAVNFYAIPRMTRDIDVVVALESTDAERVVNLFNDDYYIDEFAVEDAIIRSSSFNAIHYAALVKVDFIIRRDEEYRRVEFDRRRRLVVDDVGIWVVAPEDLILSKLDWARESRSERQFGDVRGLLRSAQPLDGHYLQTWATHLGLDALLREVTA